MKQISLRINSLRFSNKNTLSWCFSSCSPVVEVWEMEMGSVSSFWHCWVFYPSFHLECSLHLWESSLKSSSSSVLPLPPHSLPHSSTHYMCLCRESIWHEPKKKKKKKKRCSSRYSHFPIITNKRPS